MLIRSIVLMSAALLGPAVSSVAQTAKSRPGAFGDIRVRQPRTSNKIPARSLGVASRVRVGKRGRSAGAQPTRGISLSVGRRTAGRAFTRLAGYGIGVRAGLGLHCEVPEYRIERVWVAGCERRVWVPAKYEYRYDSYCRTTRRVLVRAGHYHTVRDPGHWESRRVRVYSPAHGCGPRLYTFRGHFH